MLVLRNIFAILAIFFFCLPLACCTSQMQISVKPVELINPPIYTTDISPSKPIKIFVTDFSLNTGKRANEIGEAKTGAFNTPVPIILDKPANLIISNTIKQGLSNKGCQIVGPEEANYSIDGTVEVVWVDEYATGWSMEYAKAHVMYDVILRDRNGKSLWATTIETFKTSGKSVDATDDDLPTLKSALNESISKILEDASFWNVLLQ